VSLTQVPVKACDICASQKIANPKISKSGPRSLGTRILAFPYTLPPFASSTATREQLPCISSHKWFLLFEARGEGVRLRLAPAKFCADLHWVKFHFHTQF
jgi:hypothetical protein